jgi:hypothetical protein
MAIAGYMAAVVLPAFAKCPPGTAYRCTQGYNGKVICGCH